MTPGRWLAVIIVVAIALTWLNYAYCQYRLKVIGFPLSTSDNPNNLISAKTISKNSSETSDCIPNLMTSGKSTGG